MSLAVDLASRGLMRSAFSNRKEGPMTPLEADEYGRRAYLLLYYLLRGPFYQHFTKYVICVLSVYGEAINTDLGCFSLDLELRPSVMQQKPDLLLPSLLEPFVIINHFGRMCSSTLLDHNRCNDCEILFLAYRIIISAIYHTVIIYMFNMFQNYIKETVFEDDSFPFHSHSEHQYFEIDLLILAVYSLRMLLYIYAWRIFRRHLVL